MDEIPSPTGLSQEAMVVPIAAIGTLSQAWFDALGLARPKQVASHSAPPLTQKGSLPPRPKAVLPQQPEQDFSQHATIRRLVPREAPGKSRFHEPPHLTITAKSPRIWRVAQASGTANDGLRRSAGRITIRSKYGVVRMLVQRHENHLRITAVCDPAIIGTINDALTTARVRLGARGVVLDARTHEENAA